MKGAASIVAGLLVTWRHLANSAISQGTKLIM